MHMILVENLKEKMKEFNYDNSDELTVICNGIVLSSKNDKVERYKDFIDIINLPQEDLIFKYRYNVSKGSYSTKLYVDNEEDLKKQVLSWYNRITAVNKKGIMCKKYLIDNDLFPEILVEPNLFDTSLYYESIIII